MHHSIPDLSTPKGVQSFIEKLQIRAKSMKDRGSEFERNHEDLVSGMEWLLVTRPARKLADSVWATSIAKDAKRTVASRMRQYVGSKSLEDIDHEAMEAEIAGEYFVNS